MSLPRKRAPQTGFAEAPALCLLAPPWREDRVLAELIGALGETAARIVGGAVRNALIGRAVVDIDVATRLLPRKVMERASRAGFSVHPVGLDHGSVLLAKNGRTFEVTTLRRDVRTDGRHAVVAFTTDWAEDARRRDFTMNALYATFEGAVYDPLGRGIADALARRVRFIGDARRRIREDYLRILRFFRFWAEYDTHDPDPAALEAITRERAGLSRISRERVREETRRLMMAPRVGEALWLMRKTGVAAHVFPPDCAGDRTSLARIVAQDERLTRTEETNEDSRNETARAPRFHGDGFTSDWLLRLIVYCGAGDSLREAFRLSRAESRRLRALRKALEGLERAALNAPPEAVARKAAARYGKTAVIDALRLRLAREECDEATAERAFAALAAWTPPVFPLSGRDALALGIAPGPAVGQLLERVRHAWIEAGFAPSGREALRALLRETAREMGLLNDAENRK